MSKMASASASSTERLPAIGHGGGGFEPPPDRGGGGEGSGGGSPDYGQRLRRARMALFFGAGSITVLFITFTIVFVVAHGSSSYDEHTNSMVRNWIKVALPVQLLLMNTLILLASSVTVEIARRRIARDVALAPVRTIPGVSVGRERGLPWLVVTAVLGIVFLCGQALAWRELLAKGFYLSSGASSSFIYLLTATHALHLTGGIIVLLYALGGYFVKRPVESRHIVVDVTAWYWHFMLVLWVYILALLKFAG